MTSGEATRDEPGRDDSEEAVVRSLEHVMGMIGREVQDATRAHGPVYHSAHEAFGVLLEEVEEFKEWVWRKRGERIRSAMVKELVQVAAVATKYAAQLIRDQQAVHRKAAEARARIDHERDLAHGADETEV